MIRRLLAALILLSYVIPVNSEDVQPVVFIGNAIEATSQETLSEVPSEAKSRLGSESEEDDRLEKFIDEVTWETAKELFKKKLKQVKQTFEVESEASLSDRQEPFGKRVNENSPKITEEMPSEVSQISSQTEFMNKYDDVSSDAAGLSEKMGLKKKPEDIRKEMFEPIWQRYVKALDEALEETISEEQLTDKEVLPNEENLESLYGAVTKENGSEVRELGTNDHSNATLLSGLSPGDLIVVERCPLTQREYSTNCFCTRAKQWTCPAGFFCLAPGSPRPCPLGFYCPEDTFQPSFCCGGYYCPASNVTYLCPAGKYCQEGSIAPRPCHFGHCPVGSRTIRKYEVFIFFLCFLVVVWIGQALRRRQLIQQRYASDRLVFSGGRREPEDFREGALLGSNFNGLRFTVEFEELGLRLANGEEIMRGVSGKLSPGKTCAIMGPSGAGKTTLVSLLTGKVTKTSGSIYVNGRLETLAAYRKLVGFVPQEDVMLRKLTVYEIISHAAGLRLPVAWSNSLKRTKTCETIKYLGLGPIIHQVIGDEEQRGISGGQRKRVNIGMELVAEPAVLFLDEPTSGLDSSTAVEVCALLSRVAREQKLTVAAVIHSPSPAAFDFFDDLLLLGVGGRMLYHGPRDQVTPYFESLGFLRPTNIAPADYIMEIASGKAQNEITLEIPQSFLVEAWDFYQQSSRLGQEFDPRKILDSLRAMAPYAHNAPLRVSFDDNAKGRTRSLNLSSRIYGIILSVLKYVILLFLNIYDWVKSVLLEIYETAKGSSHRLTPGPLEIFKLCIGRAMVQIFRPPMGFVSDQLLHLGCGLFISIAAQNSVFLGPLPEIICNVTPLPLYVKCKRPVIDQAAQIGNFISWGIGFAGISVGAGTFGNERVVFWRECSWGMPAFPYFVAKVVADIPRLLVAALMFTLSLVAVYPNAAPFHQLYYIVAALYYWGFSAGYLISALVRKEKAPLVGVAVALFWALVFSGVQPTLREIKAVWGPHVLWLWDISAPRWAIGAFYIAETESEARGYMDPEKVGRRWFGYHQDSFTGNLTNVLFIALGWQLLAFLAFKLCSRDKMQ